MGNGAGQRSAEKMIPLSQVRAKIIRIWLYGAGFSALILVVASLLRGQADAAREVWSWFLPLVMPTIGLMIGVVGAAAMTRHDNASVRQSYFGIAKSLSLGYLVVLSLTILLEPFSPLRGAELHAISNYWMGPFQGLVVAALGYLFTSGEETDREQESTPVPQPPAGP